MAAIASKQREEWLDILKGICAVLVVLGHGQKPEIFAFLFRPFFLMCFFFVGGYVAKAGRNTAKFIAKQFVTTIEIITIAIAIQSAYSIIFKSTIPTMDGIIGAYLQSYFAYPTYSPIIWFIPCICIAKCIFQLVLMLSKGKEWTIVVFSLILSATGYFFCRDIKMFLPWHIQTAVFVQIFFCMGYLYKKYREQFKQYETVFLSISTLCYLFLIFQGSMTGDLALLKMSDMSRYTSSAFFGTIAMVMISQRINSKALQYIGKNSLFMFVFQGYFIKMIYPFLNMIGAEEPKSVVSILATILIIAILCCLCYLRDYIYSYINGRWNKTFKPII